MREGPQVDLAEEGRGALGPRGEGGAVEVERGVVALHLSIELGPGPGEGEGPILLDILLKTFDGRYQGRLHFFEAAGKPAGGIRVIAFECGLGGESRLWWSAEPYNDVIFGGSMESFLD